MLDTFLIKQADNIDAAAASYSGEENLTLGLAPGSEILCCVKFFSRQVNGVTM